jgi:hypothetical protein
MLLGLNHSLYHDPLPPWGFEFLIWINCQAWWHYTHYGFKTGHEPQSQDTQEDDKSSSDKASVGERPERRASGDEQEEPGDRDPNSGFWDESVPVDDILQPPNVTEQCPWENQLQPPLETPRCPLCCTCADTVICGLRCLCHGEDIETAGLLPRFDWERDDDGQDFGTLL